MNGTKRRLREYFRGREMKKNIAKSTESAMRKTILLAELELKEQNKKRTVGFGRFLLEQVRIAGMRIWTVQIGTVLAAYLLLHLMTGMELAYFTARQFAFMTGIFGILLFSLAIPFLYRAQKYKMLEIEAGAKYSVWKLLLARLLIFGIGDIFMLFGIVWQISRISPLTILQTVFCLCLPFLLALNGGMYLLRKVIFVHFQRWAYGMCTGIGGIFMGVAAFYPAYYEMKFPVLVSCTVLLLAGGVIYQCFALFHGNGQAVYE